MVHAKLGIAEENSGKLVTTVKKKAKEIAEKNGNAYILVDGSPGIGCPVIASLTGADLVVIVTEPTMSGEHDLERVAKLTTHFKIPTAVCVNKSDLNNTITSRINDFTTAHNLTFLGTIRYNTVVTEAQIHATTVIEYGDSSVSNDIRKIWNNVLTLVDK
jgi:MinD superfamily P-loop ATPase